MKKVYIKEKMKNKVQCPYCFERFYIVMYPEDGESQELIYDCEICCHPIEVIATWDSETESLSLLTQKSTGFN